MKKLLIIISMFTLINTSCSKYLDVNTDPTKLTNVDPVNMITSAIVKAGYNTYSDLSIYSGIFTNQVIGTDRQSLSTSNYTVQAGDFDNIWKYGFFTSSLKSAYDLKETAKTKNQPHYQAIGNILLAYGLIQATDVWGDIPYSQAFQGLTYINPVFDPQQNIYASSESLLKEAITLLAGSNNGVPISASTDNVYGGNAGKWSKLANSLLARNYLHLAKIDPSNYAKAANAALSGIQSSSDNAEINFVDNGSYNGSPWYQFNTQRGDIVVHDSFVARLKATSDPRKAFFVDADGYVGSYFASDNTKLPLMSYDELLFILAEAQAGQGQSATSTLAKAISANLVRITGKDDATFAAAQSADGSLANVMNQKYVALFLSPECWTDWRRTSLPALTPNVAGSEIPRSYFYSAQEQKVNANCPANTTIYRRVWWDK